jgi:peroxiredoxin family protein
MAMTETRPTTMQEVVTAERVSALEERLSQLEAQMQQVREELPENRVSIIVFSGDLDKVLPAFIIATGAAAMGMQVSLFFTFWGLNALKKRRDLSGKGFPLTQTLAPSSELGKPTKAPSPPSPFSLTVNAFSLPVGTERFGFGKSTTAQKWTNFPSVALSASPLSHLTVNS